jgi:putative YphP/YqiW family bacilliredoxin
MRNPQLPTGHSNLLFLMPYPEALVAPMRQELTRLGVEELRTPADVDAALAQPGTTLLVVNSVCGCAAANARPAVALARQADVQPDRFVTVFAGQDLEATAQARAHLTGIPPSSPFMALMKDGDPVFVVERRHIEGRSASAIATDLVRAFEAHCGEAASGDGAPARPDVPQASPEARGLPSTFRSIL